MGIDQKDKRILGELLDNCRQSNNQIGKKVNLSREGVAQRIKKLESDGVIQAYITEINLAVFGDTRYSLVLKAIGNILDLETHIQENPSIVFAERALGRYNFILGIKAKTPYVLNKEIKQIKQILGPNLKEFEISTSIANYDTQSSHFKDPILTTTIKDISEIYHPKELETKIIKELCQNSKISLVDLATKTGVSALTVAEKIKHLKKLDILKNFRILIGYKKLNLNRYSLVLDINPLEEQRLLEFCKNHKSIIDTSEILGKFNYSLEILAKDNEAFRQVVDQIISKFKNQIQNYESLILLEEIKHLPK